MLSNQGNPAPINISLAIVANVSGASIPFASLRKASIADSKDISRTFVCCVESAMCRIQGLFPSLFYSKEDIEFQATKKYTLHISRAIARLIRFSSVKLIIL